MPIRPPRIFKHDDYRFIVTPLGPVYLDSTMDDDGLIQFIQGQSPDGSSGEMLCEDPRCRVCISQKSDGTVESTGQTSSRIIESQGGIGSDTDKVIEKPTKDPAPDIEHAEDKVEEPKNFDPLSHEGMFDDEINYTAKELGLYKCGYLGTVPIDKIHELANVVKPSMKQFGFIFNTDPSDKPGQHWIAVCYISQFRELDYYNSLAEQPTDQFLDEIKPVIDALALPYYLKFKINNIARQGMSQNCGYHALQFLYRMLCKGEKYKFASGYSEVRKGENEIKTFKHTLHKFGYI